MNFGADIGTVMWPVSGGACCIADWRAAVPEILGIALLFKVVPAAFADLKVREEKDFTPLGAALFTVLAADCALTLIKTTADFKHEQR